MITTAKALELLAAERERIRQERLTMEELRALTNQATDQAIAVASYWRKRAIDAEKRNEALIIQR